MCTLHIRPLSVTLGNVFNQLLAASNSSNPRVNKSLAWIRRHIFMLEQTHLKCHQNTVPDSALSQTTSSAHLQVPERRSMRRNQPAGKTWSNQEISIPFKLSKKSNPENVLQCDVITLWHWIQTRRVTRSMMLCKLFHFTPCWTQNGVG